MLFYYSKTKREFLGFASLNEVLYLTGVSARTRKNNMSTKISAVRDHMSVYNNTMSFEDFSVLANGTIDSRVKLKESRDSPQLKKHLSQPL